jgi:hypothetical protein
MNVSKSNWSIVNYSRLVSNWCKESKTSKIAINDEIKRKREKKKKSVNRNLRSTSHCTCSIKRVIELEDDSKQTSLTDLFE